VHEENFEENGRAAYVTDPDDNVVELWTWPGAGTSSVTKGLTRSTDG
jgi:hypothetical protein